MHYIVIPEPVLIKNLKTGAPLLDEKGDPKQMGLFDLVCDVAFNDRRNFGEGWKAAVALQAIHTKFSTAKPGDVIVLDDDHYERLNSSLLCLSAETDKDNGIRYDPKVLFQILPLLRAVKEAMSESQYEEFKSKKPSSAVIPINS